MATQKIHLLTADPALTRSRLLMSGSPSNGKLYKITVEDLETLITGKEDFLDSEDFYIVVPDGYMVDKILIKPSEDQTLSVGLTPSGTEIMLETELSADEWKPINTDVIADGSSQTIYFTGLTDLIAVKIYKRKL